MPRLRLYDMRLTRLPEVIGRCQADTASLAEAVNSAQQRLLYCREAGDEGWYGTFAEVRFNNVSRTNPYITLSRNIARIQAVNICDRPYSPRNQYFEYLDFGSGRMPKTKLCLDNFCVPQLFQRNNVVTFVDLPKKGMKLRVYTTAAADVEAGKRVLLQGWDTTDSIIYTQDSFNQVEGQFVAFASPFVDSGYAFNYITGIQKDTTVGHVQIFAVDPDTDDETLLLTMEPSETVATYRRYYFHNLPASCCPSALNSSDCAVNVSDNISITAIAKLEPIPVVVDTDYLLLQNQEAIIEECNSRRLFESDHPTAKQESAAHHQRAVQLLNGELVHYYGKNNPAVNFQPFGSARLECLNVGMM